MKYIWLRIEIIGSFLHRLLCKKPLPNFRRVTDGFFRGGQPSENGFDELHNLGFKTIINMRAIDSDQKYLKDRFHYAHLGFHPSKPSLNEVIAFLKIVKDKKNHPVFLHCYFGTDRTGMLCALYRIIIEEKSKEEAIEEMKQLGFHFWHRKLIRFIQDLDVEAIRDSVYIET